jgi:hypothetical protein
MKINPLPQGIQCLLSLKRWNILLCTNQRKNDKKTTISTNKKGCSLEQPDNFQFENK